MYWNYYMFILYKFYGEKEMSIKGKIDKIIDSITKFFLNQATKGELFKDEEVVEKKEKKKKYNQKQIARVNNKPRYRR